MQPPKAIIPRWQGNEGTQTQAEHQSQQPSLKVTNWKDWNGKGSLRGSFSVTLPSGLILHDVALFGKGDARWVAMPRQRYTDKAGNTSFKTLVEFASRKVADNFRDQVLIALEGARLA